MTKDHKEQAVTTYKTAAGPDGTFTCAEGNREMGREWRDIFQKNLFHSSRKFTYVTTNMLFLLGTLGFDPKWRRKSKPKEVDDVSNVESVANPPTDTMPASGQECGSEGKSSQNQTE